MFISKNQIKQIKSLQIKKNREQSSQFIAEGSKIVLDLIAKMELILIVITEKELEKNPIVKVLNYVIATEQDIKKITSLNSAPQMIGIFNKKEHRNFEDIRFKEELSICLDNIQDPGNLGTIIRIADWFGIKNIICSIGTVDVYNSKTIQSTMGAIAKVNIYYTDLPQFIIKLRNERIPIYGTFLNGENIYHAEIEKHGVIIMGNEGQGISKEIENLIEKKLLIPSFNNDSDGSESLNVSVATGIICSEFRRR